jgi:outer membrane lipoprotein LolB
MLKIWRFFSVYGVRCAGLGVAVGYVLLGGCATVKPLPPPAAVSASVPLAWDARVARLQQLSDWDLSGRTAVAVGTQGWQASLNWRQHGAETEARLAGPLGVGATVLRLNDAGLSINGGPASGASDAVAQLQQRLGFDLPLGTLRYWLLGVPDPSAPFDLVRNDQDRAQTLTQDGWTMNYDHYLASDGDWLPGHVVLNRGDVRVRIVVDHWDLPR